jgi:hypothetical protein
MKSSIRIGKERKGTGKEIYIGYGIGVCMVGYFAKPNYIQTKTRYMDLDT